MEATISENDILEQENKLYNELLPKAENVNIIDDIAIVTLTMDLKGKFNNVPFEALYRYIRFWKKFDEGIKVVGGSGVTI